MSNVLLTDKDDWHYLLLFLRSSVTLVLRLVQLMIVDCLIVFINPITGQTGLLSEFGYRTLQASNACHIVEAMLIVHVCVQKKKKKSSQSRYSQPQSNHNPTQWHLSTVTGC